jgi:hypothetical protein
MTLSDLQWRLLYHSNLLVQESLKQSNASLISVLDPLPKQRSRRRPKTKARGRKRA